ncbi:MAG TPA: 7,8-didemethyl-8-hydroxy-5-deazariboflavin synthase [Gammaproteobacteria bacterium]|nr:7,8-didemethyl-8-hydroxy-5-deazariboflavin synthase [Gammaproteobacteria bacterium]
MSDLGTIIDRSMDGILPSSTDARVMADTIDSAAFLAAASTLRDRGFGNLITYSKKVFIPLTHLCRDVCHYCTFAQAPKKVVTPYLAIDQILETVGDAADLGCKEVLFTLGEKPELRYKTARDALLSMGYTSTTDYLHDVAKEVFEKTGLRPHLNPGTLTLSEIERLRQVAPSMGIMLESVAERLTAKGMPHYGSPDKDPKVSLQTLADAGRAQIPFTTGILIGIGETRRERVESLLAIRDLHESYGHIQEIIIQNFRAKLGTNMVGAPEPDIEEMIWTIAVARLLFGSEMSIQAPPNLSPGALSKLIKAGINDWGGVSPVTPDFVNPEAPWPELDLLGRETANAGKHLHERLTVYPRYALEPIRWVDEKFHTPILQLIDAVGYPRIDSWSPGDTELPPDKIVQSVRSVPKLVSADVQTIIDRAWAGVDLELKEIERLFNAHGDDFSAVCQAADQLRFAHNGDEVTYVVNRNINYTNVCYFKCQFCAFSKGKLSENLRGKPYDLSKDEIQRRVREAWDRGATEVCMQGGIHPQYTGQTYLSIVETVKAAVPEMHIHAFSPLEVWQGAQTTGLSLEKYLIALKAAGLDTLPGTAAEILDDEVRAVLCPDKINTAQWLSVMRVAHEVGFNTTATIMYGHIDKPRNWARHLLNIRTLQKETGGFTEFVPLPFVHMESPIYAKGRARKGPTFRESVLMHAVSRLTLNPHITNVQASWVKMGHSGVLACLNAGVNDLGGTLMNESITRAAGAGHGQETSPETMVRMIESAGRIPRQRSTVYGDVSSARKSVAFQAPELAIVENTPAQKYERTGRRELVRPGMQRG